MKTKSN